MNLVTLAVLGTAGYFGWKAWSEARGDTPLGPFRATPGTVTPPEPERTRVTYGSRALLDVTMQREPETPQLIVGPWVRGGAFAVQVIATVRDGIWHEYVPGQGTSKAHEDRHEGMNACGTMRWRGAPPFGGALQVAQPWRGLPSCPPDRSGKPGGNVLAWLSGAALVDVAGNLRVTLWNQGDRYRGNRYDLRFDWAFTPPP